MFQGVKRAAADVLLLVVVAPDGLLLCEHDGVRNVSKAGRVAGKGAVRVYGSRGLDT